MHTRWLTWAASAATLLVLAGGSTARAAAGSRSPYVPREVVVGYAPRQARMVAADIARVARARGTHARSSVGAGGDGGDFRVIRVPRGVPVAEEIARLRRQPGVAYAVPNYIAHAATPFIPNNPGRAHVAGGWQRLQWNFLAPSGIDTPDAWANLIADHRPGGRGVVIAILDTGIAYRNWHQFRKSPGFRGTRFIDPHDFVATDPGRCDKGRAVLPESPRFPLDREGHGTFVAGIIAEATNDGFGLTGIAYGATIMPVRILDACGDGDAGTIARGIRYAVRHHAKVINLSLEFSLGVNASDIPDIISAIRYAHRHGAVVVGAAGNEGVSQLAYPAAAPEVISVGATTRDRCVADYSNGGPRLDLVAPGGGDDSPSLTSDPNCHPDRSLPTIYQLTILNPQHPGRFGYPRDVYGTSMSAPEVSATAALVIASGVIGRHPTPDQVLHRLETTAQTLGTSKPNPTYGYGLLDAAAATSPSVQPAK